MAELTHEVWGGYSNEYGECDNPQHLEDCFSYSEAVKAAEEYGKNKDMFAFVKRKNKITSMQQ